MNVRNLLTSSKNGTNDYVAAVLLDPGCTGWPGFYSVPQLWRGPRVLTRASRALCSEEPRNPLNEDAEILQLLQEALTIAAL